MRRRSFIAAGSGLLTLLAGCSADTSSASGPSGETEATGYQVRVSYDGDWSGSIASGDSSRSVDGSGTETFAVDGNPSIVSVNAQKRDDGTGELTVEILKGGKVVADRSTTAAYGLAQVTSEDGNSDSGGASGGRFEVRVEYSGRWQGSVAAGGSSESVDGSGARTIAVDGNPDIVSANAQKQDDSGGTLTISILQSGTVVKQSRTTAAYGVAQVTYSNY